MVVLNTRFAVLGAFVYLASLSLAPLSVGAVAIRIPSFKGQDGPSENENQARSATWSPINNALRAVQLGNARRHHHHLLHVPLLDLDILKREGQHHFNARHTGVAISNKHGASYLVLPATHSKRTVGGKGRFIMRRDQGGVPGHVDIMSPDSRNEEGKKIASLVMSNSTDGTYVLNASEDSATPMYLVDTPSTSRAQSDTPDSFDSNVPVMLQVPIGEDSSKLHCATYSTQSSSPGPLTVEECGQQDLGSGKSQTFAYNRKTGVVQPEYDQDRRMDSSDNAQGVLERADGATARNVTLVFVPDAPKVADVEGAAVTATMTTTTTVTVTDAAVNTASLAAADFVATSSFEPSPTDPALTSTADASAPTAASAGVLDVQVVGRPGSSSAMFTPTSDAAAAPTSSINAQDIAAGIAASSSSPPLATGAPSAVAPAASSGSTFAPSVAAAPNSTASGLDTTAATAPTESPFSTEPYKWRFRRE
ncbi:hypothetical protein LshimejAT787_1001660 [Lyophyllum shimeji]|uniref:Uncharacterized protein n=1 Tax=Lyophyllum shimeji TaxID=47721 RepID=A0A9P3PUN3_LYOSH|nr:hypothetical protein LshimejAT787_1001660 [Lyophyllum shimeji]